MIIRTLTRNMMISLILHQSKITSILFFFFLLKTLNAQPTYLLSYCYKTGNYTTNSLYKSNLDSLLTALRSQSSDRGFYSHASGSSLTTTVSGTFLCRGDISSSTCETCVSRASKNVLIECPVQKEAIIWYEECFVRYSNRQIFSVLDLGPYVTWTTYDTMTYSSYFISTLEDRIDRLIQEAYSSSSYFAEETYPVSFLGELYDLRSLVQCTPDLDQYDCYRCLKSAYNETTDCCYGRRWGLVYSANCMLTFKAIFSTPPPPPPPPPSPPPPLSFSSGNDSPDSDNSFSFNLRGRVVRKIIGPIIVAVVMVLAICLCSLCCYCKKKKEEVVNEREITSTEMSTANVAETLPVAQPIAKTEPVLPN